jgi:uncharacterized protein (UPF0264 family)
VELFFVISVRPQLLVSVRNADEALSAKRGRVEIIDVKEPLHGSLGRADAETILSIGRAVSRPVELASDCGSSEFESGNWQSRSCLSLALGEVLDWHREPADVLCSYQNVIQVARPAYLKLGLAGLKNDSATASPGISPVASTWEGAWTAIRTLFTGDHQWVAVAYADSDRAHSPTVAEVCEAAIATQCRVLLLDTYLKDGTTLLDWQSLGDLQKLREKTQRHGLLLALAGRVSVEVASKLLPIHPDIIGVRGAVCHGGERKSSIDEQRIRHLRMALSIG